MTTPPPSPSPYHQEKQNFFVFKFKNRHICTDTMRDDYYGAALIKPLPHFKKKSVCACVQVFEIPLSITAAAAHLVYLDVPGSREEACRSL